MHLCYHAGEEPHQFKEQFYLATRKTGITIMQMDQGLDTGDILLKKSIPILHNDNTKILYDKLAILGAECVVETLNLLKNQKIVAIPQNEQEACYAPKLKKEEAKINWKLSAERN